MKLGVNRPYGAYLYQAKVKKIKKQVKMIDDKHQRKFVIFASTFARCEWVLKLSGLTHHQFLSFYLVLPAVLIRSVNRLPSVISI